jgi:hypothetical protein
VIWTWRLLDPLESNFDLSTRGRCRIAVLEFVPADGGDDALLRQPDLIGVRGRFQIKGDALACLIDGVGAVISNADGMLAAVKQNEVGTSDRGRGFHEGPRPDMVGVFHCFNIRARTADRNTGRRFW